MLHILTRRRNYFKTLHPENISGLKIANKIRNGKETDELAFVFQVNKKLNKKKLKASNEIPKFIRIRTRTGKYRKVLTDIIETGPFRFHYGIGGAVNLKGDPYGGSAGLFLRGESGGTYLLTCYHVLGKNLMRKGIYAYASNGAYQNNVILKGNGETLTGTFYKGRLSSELDAALVTVSSGSVDELNSPLNALGANGRAGRSIPGELSIGMNATVYGWFDYGKSSPIVNLHAVVFNTETGSNLTNLIQFKRITRTGDSGGLVTVGSAALPVGIVVGGDDMYSYAVPLSTILNYYNLTIA